MQFGPAVVAGLLPTLFIPVSVDAYVLPRATIAMLGGGAIAAAGLVAGRRTLGPLRLPALAVGAVAVLAGLASIAPAASIAGTYGRYESLPTRLAYLGLFCGAAWLGERRWTIGAYLVGCGVAAAEALYQAATGLLPRADGNLGQPNLLGALLAMAVPLALDRARTAGSPARRAWLALTGLLAAGLAVSLSRSGWLGALVGCCVLATFLVSRARLRRALAGTAVLLVLAGTLVLATPLRGLNADTGGARLGVWRDSLSVIADRPWLGSGEDTMGLVFGRHQSADWEPGHSFDRAHSAPLDLAATQGLLGLAASLWLFGAWWVQAWRRRAAPSMAGLAGASAAYIAWSVLNFDWVPATAAFWLLAGCASGERTEDWPARPAARPRRAFALVLVLLAAVVAVPAQAADIAFFASRADLAVALAPLQAHYHAARGDLADLRRAAELGDPDPSTYVALGDAEAAAGQPAAARRAYAQALDRYPFDPQARRRLG